jgi:hypothetical protein
VRAVSRVRFGVDMSGETGGGIVFGGSIRADNAWEISAQYDPGGGATVNGGVVQTYPQPGLDADSATIADYGIAMSFRARATDLRRGGGPLVSGPCRSRTSAPASPQHWDAPIARRRR